MVRICTHVHAQTHTQNHVLHWTTHNSIVQMDICYTSTLCHVFHLIANNIIIIIIIIETDMWPTIQRTYLLIRPRHSSSG
jgi:hypothetical protein